MPTQAWRNSVVQVKNLVLMSFPSGARSAASIAAIMGFVIGPSTMLGLLVLNGYLFPHPNHLVNITIVSVSRAAPALVWIAVSLEILRGEWRRESVWESVVGRTWLVIFLGSIGLAAVFVWLRNHGLWHAWILDGGTEAHLTFFGLYTSSAGISILAVLGRACVTVKRLVRKRRFTLASIVASLLYVVYSISEVLLWPCGDVLSRFWR